MKTYKLISITHSGIEGRRGTPRKERMYLDILGVMVFLDAQKIQKGEHLAVTAMDENKNVNDVFSREEVLSQKYKKYEDKVLIEVETATTIFNFKLI